MATLPRTADVVIIGGGVHGASLAYHFARKQAGRVLLIEKKFLASGPTGRSTAMVRRYYGMDFFTRTASAAADVFQRWTESSAAATPGSGRSATWSWWTRTRRHSSDATWPEHSRSAPGSS